MTDTEEEIKQKKLEIYNALVKWLGERNCKEPKEQALDYCKKYGLYIVRKSMNDSFCISVYNFKVLCRIALKKKEKQKIKY